MTELTLDQARAVLESAVRRSQELGVKMNIAVVDAGANLKAFHRMDGAWLGSIDIAIRKARTARFFDMPTGERWGSCPSQAEPCTPSSTRTAASSRSREEFR